MQNNIRIDKIVSLVEEGSKVLDIGTDHAYVPIKLFRKKIVEKADGTEITNGPLENAKENIKKYNLENKINIFLSNGFESVDIKNYDTIIISGMGGNLISKILDYDSKLNQTLILNPTNKISTLRKKLNKLNYRIEEEYLLKIKGIFYVIIKANKKKFTISMTKKEIFLGPKLIKSLSSEIDEFYKNQMEKYKKNYNLSNKKENYKKYLIFKKGLEWREKKL